MTTKLNKPELSRRALLKSAAAGGVTLAASATAAQALEKETKENPITTKQDWNQVLGDGVDANPYGKPSEYEKNVIRRSGENISALEVETALLLNPAIDKVAVAPVYDEMRGDEVMACIVLEASKENVLKTAVDIFTQSYEHLSYFKAPGYIAFVDELPLTPSQKLKRGEMKKLCARLLEDEKAIDLRHMKKRVLDKDTA